MYDVMRHKLERIIGGVLDEWLLPYSVVCHPESRHVIPTLMFTLASNRSYSERLLWAIEDILRYSVAMRAGGGIRLSVDEGVIYVAPLR